jgi:predicted GIY-YIG superfamily endonuclease
MSSVAYLYKIVNLVNDKIYVGVTKYPEKRFREHCHKNSSCTKLKRAMVELERTIQRIVLGQVSLVPSVRNQNPFV